MGTIPGPIISFRWQAGDLNRVISDAGAKLKKGLGDAGTASAKATVSAWQAAAAQLRASIASEAAGTRQIAEARRAIISAAEREISILRTKAELTKQELSTLKSATMEIERQRSALMGTGGLTTGTRSVIQQILSGVSARAGSYGGGFGSFAGLKVSEPVGKFAEEASGGSLALLGVGAAAAAAGTALAVMAKKGGDFAVQMERISEKTGLSIANVVKLRSAAEALDVDFDTVTHGFKKFSQQITEALGADIPHASIEAKRAAEIFSILGVNVKKAATEPMSALEQLSKTLGQLPDGAVKTAVAVNLFGKAGQELIPILNEMPATLLATKKSSEDLARALGTDVAGSADALKAQMVNFRNETLALEVTLASVVIPALVSFISWIGRVADAVKNPGNTPTDVTSAVGAILRAKRQQFTPKGQSDFASFLSNYNISLGAGGGVFRYGISSSQANNLIANPDTALSEFSRYLGGNTSGDFTKFTQSASAAAAPEATLSKTAKDLAAALVMDSQGAQHAAKAHKALKDRTAELNKEMERLREKMQKEGAQTFEQNSMMTLLLSGNTYWLDKNMQNVSDAALKGIQTIAEMQVKAEQDAAEKTREAWQKQFDELKSDAGRLFDAMVGGSKNFGQMFTRIIEGILLAPIKAAFENVVAAMLQKLEQAISGKGKTGKGIGGVLGKILGALGIGENQTLTVAQQNVTAANVTIIGAGGIGGVAGGGPGNNLFGGVMSFGGGGMKGIGSVLGSVLPGAVLLGAGLHDSNPVAIAMGIGMTGGGALTSISKMLGPSSQLGKVLGNIGSVLPGLGIVAASTQMGGVGGFLTGMGGGAMSGMQIGSMIAPGIGTAIGAAVGAVVGGITSLFGGGSAARHAANWQKAVTRAMRGEQIIMPPSETFAFSAMGSMAQTLGTTFSEGPGGRFGNVALPANTPFFANAILGYPKTGGQLTALQNALAVMNNVSPFGGVGAGQNPFTGLPLPPGTRPFNSGAATVIHIQVDGKTIATAVARHLPTRVAHSNSGFRQAAFAANEMP